MLQPESSTNPLAESLPGRRSPSEMFESEGALPPSFELESGAPPTTFELEDGGALPRTFESEDRGRETDGGGGGLEFDDSMLQDLVFAFDACDVDGNGYLDAHELLV